MTSWESIVKIAVQLKQLRILTLKYVIPFDSTSIRYDYECDAGKKKKKKMKMKKTVYF